MGVNARGFRTFTPDFSTQLKDVSAGVTANGIAQVGGADNQLDFGGVSPGPAVTQIAYTPGTIIVEISAIEDTTGDEHYVVAWQLSDNVAFASGVTVLHSALVFGDGATVVDADDQDDNYPVGQLLLDVNNSYNGTLFRFGRLVHVLAGTTPILTYTAFFTRNQ